MVFVTFCLSVYKDIQDQAKNDRNFPSEVIVTFTFPKDEHYRDRDFTNSAGQHHGMGVLEMLPAVVQTLGSVYKF
jgi:hypothetical protein